MYICGNCNRYKQRKWNNGYLSQYWLVAMCMCSHNIIYCSIYHLFNVYSGDESKVPNMQDVVRKLLSALHHAIMSHKVRYLLNVTHCSESCCLLSWNNSVAHSF